VDDDLPKERSQYSFHLALSDLISTGRISSRLSDSEYVREATQFAVAATNLNKVGRHALSDCRNRGELGRFTAGVLTATQLR